MSQWIRKSTRLAIYMRVYCLRAFGRLTLDHIRPRSKGGSNAPGNLVTCCLTCNSSRQDKPIPKEARGRVRNARRRTLPRKVAASLVGT